MSNKQIAVSGSSMSYKDTDTGATVFEFRWDNKQEKFHSDIMSGRSLNCPKSSRMNNLMEAKDVEVFLKDIADVMRTRKTGPFYKGEIGHYFVTLIVYTITWLVIFGSILFFWIHEGSRKDYYWLMGLPFLFSLLAIISMVDEHKKNKS